MEAPNWSWQMEFPVDPATLGKLDETHGLWHETPEEIEEALELGREKARLLRWVRRHMRSRLTPLERYYVQELFFRGRYYRDVAARRGVDPSVVHRSVQRGLAKLRRQLEKGGTRTRLRATRFRGAAKDAFDGDDGVY